MDSSELALKRFATTQNRGLKIGIACRTLTALGALVWYTVSLSLIDQNVRFWTFSALGLFISIGAAHFLLIGTRYDRWWMKYLLFAVDILTVCALFTIIPVSRSDDIPQIIAFRAYGIYYLFPVIMLAALSLSWKLVIWSGVVAVIGWWLAFVSVVLQMENTYSWGDIPAEATVQDYETIFLSINFIGWGNRVEETGLLFASVLILSIAVYRARSVFFAQVRAEQKELAERMMRQRVSDMFGRFVPTDVSREIVEQDGKMTPSQNIGTVLILDIADFTAFSEGKAPAEIISALNGFLSEAADEIAGNGGVVVSYTGDGLFAAFNAPITHETPEKSAMEVSARLTSIGRRHKFNIRIGLSTGSLVSGTIGSNNRMAFTVYGETVNRASRLENLGKDLGESVLMDEQTAEAVSSFEKLRDLGEHQLRGTQHLTRVFAPLSEPA